MRRDIIRFKKLLVIMISVMINAALADTGLAENENPKGVPTATMEV
jgi:hypothetical protein